MQTESNRWRSTLSAPLLQTAAAIAILLAATVLVRLPRITRPLLGNFATRMTIHGMIARNWANGTAPAWEPTVDCLRDGKPGLHLVEVPLSAYASGALWRLCGGSLDVCARLTSIACTAVAALLLYLLARRWHGARVAYVAALVLAFSPVSITYGQGFMLEPSIVCLSVAVLLAFDIWLEHGRVWPWSLWVAALAALLLTKIYMLVLFLPLGALLWQRRTSAKRLPWWQCLVGVALAVAPALAWCAFVFTISSPTHPRSAEVHYSLAHSAGANGWPNALLAESAFYQRALANLTTVALTPLPFLLAIAAFWHSAWRRHLPWLASMAILVVFLPRKFHELNYYYLVVLPPLAIMVGLGYEWCVERWRPRRAWIGLAVLATLACSLRYSVRPAFVTPEEDRAVVAAADTVRGLASREEPVVTMHGSTIDLLYYCNRRGWAVSPEREDLPRLLEACREQGARLVVVADMARIERNAACRTALDALPLVATGDDYRIYRLDATAAGESTAAVSTDVVGSTDARLAERRAKSSTPHAPGTR